MIFVPAILTLREKKGERRERREKKGAPPSNGEKKAMASNGAWQEIRRRKGAANPQEMRAGEDQSKVKLYIPYFTNKTYAQAVGEQPASAETGPASPKNSQPPPPRPPSRPTTPPSPPVTCYYTSPHSPTSLRFPPAPSFPEWRGRCFRCLRVGHPASKCCNQLKCGRCWMDGHNLSKCKTPLNPAAKPFSPNRPEPAKQHPPSSKTNSARPVSTKHQHARQ